MKETAGKNTIAILTAVILVLALSVISLAWFYFPTSQNVNLSSDEKKDVSVRLYKMELVGTEQLFSEVSPAGSSAVDSGALAFSNNWSFFQWGDEYLLENETVQYFALECVCDTEALTAGKVALALDVTLRCTSNDVNDDEEQTMFLKVDFVDLAYAVVKSNMNDYIITSQTAAVGARALDYASFTSVTLTTDATLSTDEVEVRKGLGSYTYLELLDPNTSEPVPYFTRTTGTAPDTTDQFRSVIIFKLTADADIVTDALNEFRLTYPALFDGLIEVNLVNTFTVSCNLRTVPVKTETETRG